MKKVFKWIAAALTVVCVSLFGGCQMEKTQKITVYMPDGAPAMAFASLMDEGMENVDFRVVNPTVIASKVTNTDEKKNADLCVLPVTAASKLLGAGEEYQMLSMVTGGNLYLISKDEKVVSALRENEYKDLSYLVGKTIGVMKMNDMPGLTLKWSIENYGLEWQEIKNDGGRVENKVNLQAIEPSNINPEDPSIQAYLLAEPAVSVQINKNGFTSVCSLDTLYHKGESENGYPQAVLVAKKSIIEKNPSFIQEFLQKTEESCKNVSSLTGEQIVQIVTSRLEDKEYKTTLNANVLTAQTIARCGVRFQKAAECKKMIQSYLQNIKSVDDKVQTVSEEFFYIG